MADKELNVLLRVRSPEEGTAAQEAEKERQQGIGSPAAINTLSSFIRQSFSDAKTHKDIEIKLRLEKCQRAYLGKYDPEKLAQINERHGSNLYFNITKTKADGLKSWLRDVMLDPLDPTWRLEPTPVPSLPNDAYEAIQDNIHLAFEPGSAPSPGDVKRMSEELQDKAQAAASKDAQKRCDRMQKKMEDQMTEGGFQDAFSDFLDYLTFYPNGFLKGPVIRARKTPVWKENVLTVEMRERPEWYAPSPHDMYPGPNARNIKDTFICELVRFTPSALADMRGVDGWDTEAINRVLALWPNNSQRPDPDTNERDKNEGREGFVDGTSLDTPVEGVEFWGNVKGELLQRGSIPVDDPLKFYPIAAILIGTEIVWSRLNPDPLGEHPYFTASAYPVPGSFWGAGLPELMEDCQTPTNAALRNGIDNLALSSGPMLFVDEHAFAPGTAPQFVQPLDVILFDGARAGNGARLPITAFQPQSNIAELINTAKFFMKEADERTRIPSYTYGNEDVKGAGTTKGGLEMLMNASFRGLKTIISIIEKNVQSPALRKLYYFNCIHYHDPYLCGDAMVVPRGAMSVLIREQTAIELREFAISTNNDIDMQIIGLEGRAALLRARAERLDLPDLDDIVPTGDQLRERLERVAERNLAESQGRFEQDAKAGQKRLGAPA